MYDRGVEILYVVNDRARLVLYYVYFFFFFFVLFRYTYAWYRTTEKDGDDGRDLSLIELYTRFSFLSFFLYVKCIEFDSRFFNLSFYFPSFFFYLRIARVAYELFKLYVPLCPRPLFLRIPVHFPRKKMKSMGTNFDLTPRYTSDDCRGKSNSFESGESRGLRRARAEIWFHPRPRSPRTLPSSLFATFSFAESRDIIIDHHVLDRHGYCFRSR